MARFLATFFGNALVLNDRFLDLVSNAQNRVERGHWILKDHRDSVPA